tara:strand:+ start:199 stop:756 length:558 start_codon:yes stop_codon:yes gene_type:complete
MALSRIRSESVDLADDFDFTGTVTGAGKDWTKTAQTTTNGAATYTISGIPSGTSEIIVFGNAVDRGTSSNRAVIQLGDSGGLEDTGYTSCLAYTANSNAMYMNSVADLGGLEFNVYGDPMNFVAHCWNTSGNKWMMTCTGNTNSGGRYWINAQVEKELSGTLDRVGIVDRNGTNFAGGSFQLWYK